MLRGTFGIVIYFRNFGISNEFKEILILFSMALLCLSINKFAKLS